LKTPQAVLTNLKDAYCSQLAPPGFDRAVDLPEIETVLCKWKAHCNGQYYLGKDSIEITHALENWRSDTGDRLRVGARQILKYAPATRRIIETPKRTA